MGDLVLCLRRSINISYRVKCTKCFSDTTSFSSIHGTHIFVLKVPSTLMGRCCWKKLWGEGVKEASPCWVILEWEGRGQSVLCGGGDDVLGDWSRGHLPQTCHQQIKRPCLVLSLSFSTGSRRKLPWFSPCLLWEAWLPESLFPFLDPQKISLP